MNFLKLWAAGLLMSAGLVFIMALLVAGIWYAENNGYIIHAMVALYVVFTGVIAFIESR